MLRFAITSMGRDEGDRAEEIRYLRDYLRGSPFPINTEHPIAEPELKTLWTEVQGKEHELAEFLLQMWKRSQEDEEHAQILNDAFTGQFVGHTIELFCQSMAAYENAFDPQKYYGKIIAWHGPSGAGKSKGVDALQDKFPLFSLCFRVTSNPSDGWPPGDGPAYGFFNQTMSSSFTPEERVAAFLGAFFKVAEAKLQPGVAPARSIRDCWAYQYVPGIPYERSPRGALFAEVAREARAMLDKISNQMDVDASSHSSTSSKLVEPEQRYRQLWHDFCEDHASALIRKMPNVPYCFIALDECTDIPGVEPISLRRILATGHHVPRLWFILLGTNAKIQYLVPTSSKVSSSARFTKLECLPAWCNFGFGQFTPKEPETPLESLQVDYLRKLGRPLFATYRTTAAAYKTALKKLFSPALTFTPHSSIHVLTAFSHRVLLELGNTAIAHEMAAEAVNTNLRYAMRIDGEIVRTVCPSEPLLSLVSMDVLNTDNNFARSLRTLVKEINVATIDRGQEGELYCRLLIIRARDVASQNSKSDGNKVVSGDPKDSFSQASFAVRLVTLEEHLAALVYFAHMKSSDATEIRNLTRPYHVNVTHMIQFGSVIDAVPQDYLRRLFLRGAAVQCCHNQPVIDGFYVAYGGDLQAPFDLSKFLIIAWQSKAKAAAASQSELVASLTGPMQIDSDGNRCKPGQIVMLMDLNARAAFRSGDAYLQVCKRAATIPVYAQPTTKTKPTIPWGGYATRANEAEPITWCFNVRGHDHSSYPCTKRTQYEVEEPDFTALFKEVLPDITLSNMIAPAIRSADDALHPLRNF
ncbi:hypothetical protein B0H19DRAFT_609834 [Mycena capillaripes]|nr:hypothetical protein B0H19DRAFT_609834 [Mycena capillaripes]